MGTVANMGCQPETSDGGARRALGAGIEGVAVVAARAAEAGAARTGLERVEHEYLAPFMHKEGEHPSIQPTYPHTQPSPEADKSRLFAHHRCRYGDQCDFSHEPLSY